MSKMIGPTADVRGVVLWLIPVAALATIANQQLHGRWQAIFGVLIGIGWVALGGVVAVGLFVQRPGGRRSWNM
ncbi:hypothetical protein [Actinomadura sp. HBU206391]|uniref:hypothetical protein n=1 Tax=Actinomadura sp. HBU206391 TaxID=2731692 RepID=UPI00165013F2|nr:hypothetical protein [Actinomadura sp. HBU206391]MBC6462197.1 hypothetical protein [Actinomadura sp. HBU206391]